MEDLIIKKNNFNLKKGCLKIKKIIFGTLFFGLTYPGADVIQRSTIVEL